jgi:peptidoglycan/xylan/chitin deacetylase (PgdA/CDA1 family)
MWHLRVRLISLLDGMGVLDAAMIVRKHVRLPFLPILTYHRLGDRQRDAKDLDEHVIDATREGFEKQVALMKRRFSIVGIDDLRRHYVEGDPLPKNAALITFDDGYKDCYDIALPILKRANAKAAFFIPTDHLTERKAFWWDRTNYLVKRCTKTRIELEYPTRATYELNGDPQSRERVTQKILEVIKDTFALDIERYLQELSTATGVPWRPEDEKRITDDVLMTWDHVRELHEAGMDVGSHSRTHRVFTTLPNDELHEELVGSKKILEEKLQAEMRSIAYPVSLDCENGRKRRADVLGAVKNAGYEIGFSTSSGVEPLGAKTNPLDIQRLWVEPMFPHSYFRASLAVPQLTYRGR